MQIKIYSLKIKWKLNKSNELYILTRDNEIKIDFKSKKNLRIKRLIWNAINFSKIISGKCLLIDSFLNYMWQWNMAMTEEACKRINAISEIFFNVYFTRHQLRILRIFLKYLNSLGHGFIEIINSIIRRNIISIICLYVIYWRLYFSISGQKSMSSYSNIKVITI